MSTTWTSGDVAALEAAIKKGVRSVQYSNFRAEYHSLDEMLRLLDRMRGEVSPPTAGAGVIFTARIR